MKLFKHMLNEVQALYYAGKSPPELAVMYGVTPPNIRKFLQKHGTIMRTRKESKAVDFSRPDRKVSRFWLNKKMPADMVEKMHSTTRNQNHGMYKDGSCIRAYRRGVVKESCELCSSINNLAIHHKDFDHYNNEPSNLQIVCLSCHSRIHKNEYWRQIKENGVYTKGNSPNHWTGKEKKC